MAEGTESAFVVEGCLRRARHAKGAWPPASTAHNRDRQSGGAAQGRNPGPCNQAVCCKLTAIAIQNDYAAAVLTAV
jgi:hypothetical protein